MTWWQVLAVFAGIPTAALGLITTVVLLTSRQPPAVPTAEPAPTPASPPPGTADPGPPAPGADPGSAGPTAAPSPEPKSFERKAREPMGENAS